LQYHSLHNMSIIRCVINKCQMKISMNNTTFIMCENYVICELNIGKSILVPLRDARQDTQLIDHGMYCMGSNIKSKQHVSPALT
jgi:hypothetical protein